MYVASKRAKQYVSERRHSAKKNNSSQDMIYAEPRGFINFNCDGHNTDFFWLTESDFPVHRVIYIPLNAFEEQILNDNKILSSKSVKYFPLPKPIKNKLPINANDNYKKKEFQKVIRTFLAKQTYWYSFFRSSNIKIHLTWYKYDSNHMIIADAIREVGGIAAVWQMAFDGFTNYECRTNTDIVFGFSTFGASLEKKIKSQIPYYVITGLLNDYAAPLLKEESFGIRRKLEEAGARKIVLVMDENSINDLRWHTGNTLQQENYSYLLEKVLEVPWLGAVFKPKVASTLRKRLGPVAELLAAAEKTGRCFVFEESGRHNTSAPPLLLGLISDVCIHGHFSAGTAALECALQNLPTLLIDREGTKMSKFNELPEGKVVFDNRPETIDAVMEHLQSESGIPGFGIWGNSFLREMDPFRDGKAAFRMGTYLKWLIDGFDQGIDRETVMANAAEQYVGEWGADKVVSIGN